MDAPDQLTRPTLPTTRATRWTRRLAAGCLVASIGLAAGCGSDDGETTTADTDTTVAVDDTAPAESDDDTATTVAGVSGDVDACALLEGVDVEGIIGVPVAEATTEETYGDYVCDVRPADESVRAQFKLVIDTDNGESNFPRQREMAANPEDVAGLGDEAFRSGANLFVLDGSALIYVNVVRAETASGELTTEQLSSALSTVLDALHAA